LFLKDTSKQESQLELFSSCELELTESNISQSRVGKSAAMLGLALSMGATSILLPNHGDEQRAMAANPLSAEARASFSNLNLDQTSPEEVNWNVQPSTSNEPYPVGNNFNLDKPTLDVSLAVPLVQHEVQPGDTLWSLSQSYHIQPESIAASNAIEPSTILKVGEVLSIPTQDGIIESIGSYKDLNADSAKNNISTSQIAAAAKQTEKTVVVSGKVDELLQNRQEVALNNLKEQRSTLAAELKELNTATDNNQVDQNTIVAALPDVSSSVDFHNFKEPIPIYVPPVVNGAEVTRQEATPISPVISDRETVELNSTLANAEQKSPVLTSLLPRIDTPQVIPVPQLNTPAAKATPFSTIPRRSITPAVTTQEASYRVRKGDTLNSIARNYGVSATELIRANGISDPNLIEVDQNLVIPNNGSARSIALPVTEATQIAAASIQNTNRARLEASLNANPYLEDIRQDVSKLREGLNQNSNTATALKPSTAINNQTPDLLAAAPISTTNYNPGIQVSPDQQIPSLPGLRDAESYLPDAPAEFDGFMWPAKGTLTSGYGPRWGRMHRGIDIAAPIGTPIMAAASGEVIFSGWNSGGYGNLVKIKHANGSVSLYAHNNRLLVSKGQFVQKGQQISEMGSTGYSTGPHLHFEIHPQGSGATNPMAFLPKR
jgi:murein DD-endopeptidase MepM/ murein hydrolase activator NlpD